MSRWLLVLAGIQTVLVLVLLYKVFDLEGRITVQDASVQSEQSAGSDRVAGQPVARALPVTSGAENGALNETQLRRIVAEEIQSAMARLPVAGDTGLAETEFPEVSEAEYQARLDHALSQLEYYVARGEITPAEMANLQQDIARLDEKNRSEVFRLLVSAVSAGKIDGEL